MTDARGLEQSERPDGPFSSVLWDFDRQFRAVSTHASHEGHDVDLRAVSEGYDRALHPWMHGRRPHDLAERYGGVAEWVGFAIGLSIGVVLYGPARAAEKVSGWLS